ncbi:hypothetical protein AFA91_25710 [Mycolicibacterium goodii]|uniref:Uncharacterized protein n=1 Tax=Mycolicibacterium goodii TaxID=134601 RepID=A0A0K0XBF2_MYCGD|nr:hypothetical protein AFA91_25710 [Mycolicibacterium goodii]
MSGGDVPEANGVPSASKRAVCQLCSPTKRDTADPRGAFAAASAAALATDHRTLGEYEQALTMAHRSVQLDR